MRVLIVTKIFPNQVEPLSSPFNRQQFAALQEFCEVSVLATIPWFPGARAFRRWSQAGRLSTVPDRETVDGLCVCHPRTLFIPKFAPGLSGPLYAASLAAKALEFRGRVDVVLGSWAYPDGFAAVWLAELLGVPAVVKVHGSDINVVAKMRGPEKRLRSSLPQAARVVAVSRALGRAVEELGVLPDRIDVVPNGVDVGLFHPRDRRESRAVLGRDRARSMILYVGRLEREKGVLDLLHAFQLVRERCDADLVLLGDGRARAECEAMAGTFAGRVTLLGARPLAEVPVWLAACNVLTLPSWNEGTPNVILEALASGRRVVATRVGGIPDVINTPLLGELVAKQSPASLASALERALATSYDPKAVVRRANVCGWQKSAAELHATLLRAVQIPIEFLSPLGKAA